MGIYGNMREKVGNNHVGIHFLQKEYGLISWKKIHLTLKQERVGRSMGVTKMRFNFTISPTITIVDDGDKSTPQKILTQEMSTFIPSILSLDPPQGIHDE